MGVTFFYVAVFLSLFASASFAATKCDKLKNPNEFDTCYIKLAEETNTLALCSLLRDRVETHYDNSGTAIKVPKPANSLCLKQVALSRDDIALCRAVPDADTRLSCIKTLAFDKNNPDYCFSLEGADRQACLLKIATVLQQPRICERIESLSARDACRLDAKDICLPYAAKNCQGSVDCAKLQITRGHYQCCPTYADHRPSRCRDGGT